MPREGKYLPDISTSTTTMKNLKEIQGVNRMSKTKSVNFGLSSLTSYSPVVL